MAARTRFAFVFWMAVAVAAPAVPTSAVAASAAPVNGSGPGAGLTAQAARQLPPWPPVIGAGDQGALVVEGSSLRRDNSRVSLAARS